MRKSKRFFCLVLTILFVNTMVLTVAATQTEASASNGIDVSAKSAILMEAHTGQILYEKNADEMLRPASVTKIMTMLLIFEALEQNKLSMDEPVMVSAHAASMGGSQVFLEENETQTVQDLLKCISIASANDACVTMAERICGTEEAFVQAMNAKAASLGMEHTNFVNCCGLEAEGHLISAKDIAIMSRELITKYPQIYDYCTVWQDQIIHRTRKGESIFGLTNTNKFLKQYPYATGLKTGYTSVSKYCISATAKKDDVELIAVLMAEPDIPSRVKDVRSLMDYGFSSCKKYVDTAPLEKTSLPVTGGKTDRLDLSIPEQFSYLCMPDESPDQIRRGITLPESVPAPIEQGATVGKIVYSLGDTTIGEVPILAERAVEKVDFKYCLGKLFHRLCIP